MRPHWTVAFVAVSIKNHKITLLFSCSQSVCSPVASCCIVLGIVVVSARVIMFC